VRYFSELAVVHFIANESYCADAGIKMVIRQLAEKKLASG
jgi:hypothetical protein